MKRPAKNPCATCPYRTDVPSAIWSEEEYDKLPRYDVETPHQPTQMFGCHTQPEVMCSGWVGCHEMEDNLALRLSLSMGITLPEDAEAARDYTSPVPLFRSGAAAREHGMRDYASPSHRAQAAKRKLLKKPHTFVAPIRKQK